MQFRVPYKICDILLIYIIYITFYLYTRGTKFNSLYLSCQFKMNNFPRI